LRRAELWAADAGFPFTATHLRLDFSELKASLDGLVYDQEGRRIEIAHLNIDLPWDALRGEGLRITALEADGVAVNIQSSEPPSESTAKGAAPPSTPPRIRIDRLAIRNASVSYSSAATTVKIPSVSLESTDGRGVIRLGAPVSIGSDTNVTVERIPVQLENDNARFGPAAWRVQYADYDASGSAQGLIRWLPRIELDTEVATDPVAIKKWTDVRANAKASYRDGALNIPEFRVVRGSAEVTGSAQISDSGNAATIHWKEVTVDPSRPTARTNGSLKLMWQRSDLRDLAADGSADLNSPEFGLVKTDIKIANTKALFDIRANLFDFAIRGQASMGIERVLARDFSDIRGAVRGTVQSVAKDSPYYRIGAINISAAAALRDNTLSIREIHAASKRSVLSGAALSLNLNNQSIQGSIPEVQVDLQDFAPDAFGTVSLSGDVDGTLSQPMASISGFAGGLKFRDIPVDHFKLEGALDSSSSGVRELRGTLTGTIHPLEALKADGSLFSGFESVGVSATASFRDNVLSIQEIQAQSKASAISNATFQVNLTDKQIRGSVPTVRVDLRDVAPETIGTINLSAEINGTLDQPGAFFTASAAELEVRGNRIDSIGLEGEFAENSLIVTRLEARQGDGVLAATGNVNLTSEEVTAKAAITDFKIVQIPELTAEAALDARASGSLQSPRIDFDGEVRNIVYREEKHGNVHLEGTTDLKIAAIQADSDKYAARLKGEVALKPPFAFSGGLTASQSPIPYDKYNFVAEGAVRVSGEAQPFKANHVEFDTFKVRGEGIDLSMHGPLSTGSEMNLKVDLAALPIEGVELQGKTEALATISGDLSNPSIKGALTTENATVRVPQMNEPANVSALVDFTGSDFTIRSLEASYAGATADITGNGTWQGTGKLQFHVKNVKPENFAPGRQVTGVASLEGEFDIQSPSPEGVSGHVRVSELGIKVRDAEIHQKEPIEVELRDQMLTVRQLEIEGLDTSAKVTGYADLRDRTLHFDADADTDLAILEPFIPDAHPDGRVKTRFSLRGTPEKPNVEGDVRISDGGLLIEKLDIELEDVDLEAQLRGDRIELNRATGMINSGTFEATGAAGVSSAGLQDAKFQVKVERALLEYPEGLQSEITSKLTLTGSMPSMTLSGNVDVLNAIYQKDVRLTQELFARITTPPRPIGLTAPSSVGDQIRMEVEVQTTGPVVVKNNVAELEATGTFQVRGTAANPILLGRALVEEGGELYFGPTISGQDLTRRSDRYTIERGSIDFNNLLRTEPDLDFRATHDLEIEDERYLITLEVTGTPETLKAELSSDPHVDQQDIVAMLLTGRKFEELQGTYANFAGEQALSYVSGQLSERVLNQAGHALGLNTVRIDPVAVAEQTDLAARLTVAKQITSEFNFVYSHNLNDAKNQTWIASYKPFQNLVFRGVNDSDQQEVVVDLKHDLRFGGGDAVLKRKRSESEIRLRNITFTGSHIAEKDLLKQVTREGSPFGPHRVSQDVRNLRRFMASQGFPQSRIRAQQTTEARKADVHFEIMEGPKIVFRYEGADVPESVQKEIQQIWTLRFSDTASLRDSTALLLRRYRSEGFLQAEVSIDGPTSTTDGRNYVFKIESGDKFEKPTWVFHGIEPMEIPEPAGVVMESPEAVKERIESQFRGNAYLDVKSTVPTLKIDGGHPRFEVTVDRGKPYTVETIEFEGNRAFNSEHLREVLTTQASKKEVEEPAVRLTAEWLDTARQHITSEYWKHGYNEVQILPSTRQDAAMATAIVRFTITEGEQQRIEAIEITGDRYTNRKFIERQFEFKRGDPVDLTKVNLTRKKLYDTRLFRRVDIEMVRGTNGYIARVQLTENAPWQLRYGVAVTEHLDTGERDTGFAADVTYNNLFGRGILAGFSGKLDADQRDGRVFGSLPQLFGRKVTTSLTFFRTKEDDDDPENPVDYWGGTIQQQWRFGRHYLLSYDYSYRKVLEGERAPAARSEEDDDDTILDDPRVPIARFDVTISRDTRDDILNAKKGMFLSNSFEIAPPGIGSSVQFIRNYSQFMHFQPVKKFVFASAIRFGVAKPLKEEGLDSTLQFRTGGSTTVRAFEHEELSEEPGNYELILNQEFRFPLFWKFSGVTFFDAGQIARQSEDLFKFRYGPGIGIRIDTPFIMLRTDLGLNVQPRPGEARGRWWFGIGQAF
jgi:outer membrane protein assembly factor BamA/autotransporter translocation and assembly factor TamB